MKEISTFARLFLASCFLVIAVSQPVMAYVGPGAGLAAIGAFFALIAGVLAALFGFLWYPIKRMMRKRKQARQKNEGQEEA